MTTPAQEAPEAAATNDAEASKAPADPATAAAPVEGQAPAHSSAPATPATAADEAQKPAETPSEKADQKPADDDDGVNDADDVNEGDDADEDGIPPAARKLLAKTRREAKSLRERLHKAEAELMRRDVGAAVGVPTALVSRLSGDTAEAMTTDAKALMESLGLQPTATPPGLPRENAPQPPAATARSSAEDLDERAARMFGR